MKVEVLYFSGCPNHVPAVDCVREVLQHEGAPADTVEVEVKDAATAQQVGFLGSPTIRVDGQDVEPAARAARTFGMICRTYVYGGRRVGVPPTEWIRAAVREARGKRSELPNDAARAAIDGLKQIPNLTSQVEACCTAPAAMCYWLNVSLIACGALSLMGIYWRPLRASSAATLLFGMAVGCLANWLRNRSFHCAITGPLFLLTGVLFLLSGMRTVSVNTLWIWPLVLMGTGIAFLLESRHAKRRAGVQSSGHHQAKRPR